MNPAQILPPTTASFTPLPPPESRRRHIPNLASWIVGALVLFVLAGLAMPIFSGRCAKGAQTKAFAQAKQIGLALKMFAGDHDGNYPRAGRPELLGAKLADANAAFAVLFPDYVASESIFGNSLSVYQTRPPDNAFDRPYTGHRVKTLEPGENVYAYVTGLNDEDSPTMPLVTDGTDGSGHYVTDPAQRGGVWRGTKAIVIRLDQSGALEKLRGPDDARYVPRSANPALVESIRPARPGENLLDFSNFGPDVRLLDPAFDPQKPR